MTPMRVVRRRSRVLFTATAAAAVVLSGWASRTAAREAVAAAARQAEPQELATVEQLKTEAYKALRSGQFDRGNELIGRAAEMSTDPQLARMAGWTKSFESQRQEFAAERQKQYEKSVRKVKHLIAKGKSEFALDWTAGAYLLAEDKKAFRQEPWVDQLVRETARRAEDYDKGEQWLKALRLYSDLGSIEPAVPLWKEKLKLATRRVRLLALYAPSVLKDLQKGEEKESEEVEAILKEFEKAENPDAKAAAAEAAAAEKTAKLEEVENDEFRIDWRESLRDVTMDMLWPALVQSRENYFKEVGYTELTTGGLKGLKAVATTAGLEVAFPTLADEGKKQQFLDAIENGERAAREAVPGSEQFALRSTLAKLRTVNRQTVALPEEVLVAEFADGAFGELDPFTSMIWPSDLEEFNKTTQGEFSGVGIQIQSEEGNLNVVSPLEDSPAYKAGIKAGDVITHIDGKNAKGITLNQAVKKITGEKGTIVTLTVKSPDATVKDYPIRRDIIKVASIKGWRHLEGGGWEYLVDPENKIGYLRLTNFTKDTSKELDRAVEALNENGAKAIILDLRYNPGGLLTAATDVSDKFLKDGIIVTTRPDREPGNPPTVAMAHADPNETELPMIVLVNQYSASASEIVSGALKDQKRALIVGERTFGKGSVQMLFPLANREAYLKLTTSHYYLPSGRCIHREENSQDWGVDPDVTVEMTPEQMRAAIDARQDLDVLRDINAAPAEGQQEKNEDVAPAAQENEQPKLDDPKKEKKDLLSSDPQLAAAVLLLRMHLAGAPL
jgi:carboxyl-terminal processing protease